MNIVKKNFKSAIKDSFYTGLLSFALFFLFIGFKTKQDITSNLVLETRFGSLFAVVFVVMLVRFLYVFLVFPKIKKHRQKKISLGSVSKKGFIGNNISALLVSFALFFPFLILAVNGFQGSLKWIDNFGIQILIYVMLGWGLNITVGLAGLLDLGYVSFYAIGAYAYALLSTEFGFSFWMALPFAGFLAAFGGILLGFPILRLRGDYLAIVTLGFAEILRIIIINLREVTKGAAGISGIPKVDFFGLFSFTNEQIFSDSLTRAVVYKIFLYYVILFLCFLTAAITIRLRRMPLGQAWEALREDEIACRSLGINTTVTKLTAFSIGAMFAGMAGCFFAARQGFVSPDSFIFMESVIVLAIVVLGGMGSLIGIAVAAFAMIGGTEILRELGFLKVVFGPQFAPELYRMLLFGTAMVLMMLTKPRGFVDLRYPTILLHKKKKKLFSSLFRGQEK